MLRRGCSKEVAKKVVLKRENSSEGAQEGVLKRVY